MDTGIKMLGSSMQYLKQKLDTASNNVSNMDTPGYKKDTVIGRSFGTVLSDALESRITKGYNLGQFYNEPGVYVDEVYTDFLQGPVEQTEDPWDVAIHGDGFFTIDTDIGPLYKRSMSMRKDLAGFLVTDTGDRVVGENGHIFIGDNDFHIEENGTIRVGGQVVDRLNVVDFANREDMEKAQNGAFTGGGGMVQATGAVMQGFIESSNVELSEEMTNLIEISNKFTTNQKLIQMLDGINNISSNRLGKV
jgi:flagellar basal-body rod protein FlgG